MRYALLPLVCLALAAPARAEIPFARETGGPRLPGFRDALVLEAPTLDDVYVAPRRPGKNRVRWYGFDFREVALPELPGAGVRLFYYTAEEPAAEVAAQIIREDYLRLAHAFDYVPAREVPYVLYASHSEFQATNAFPISEGVLGVTSPIDLTLALPFFGDLEQFRHTSTHELAHEFTIQMVRSFAEVADRPSGLGGFPLWFIEGLAEYAAYGGLDPGARPGPGTPEGASGPTLPGLDPEAEAWARDLLYNPDAMEGYLRLDYFADIPRGYVHTYKLGQVRVAFLGATFGRELVLWLLKNAHHMGLATELGEGITFEKLVEIGTGFDAATVDRMFEDWLKRRYLPAYADARSRVPQVELVDELPTEPEAVITSPDGRTLLVRGFDRELGQAHLYLLDAEKPAKRPQLVVKDSLPSLESLHVLSRRTFALADDKIAWIGRKGDGDRLWVARLERRKADDGDLFRIEDEVEYVLTDAGIIEAGDPTFSPDGKELALGGIGQGGFRDVFVVPLDPSGSVAGVRRITRSIHAEADLHWHADGIYLASDATPDGASNLFRLDPATGAFTPLVTGAWDMWTPVPTPAGLLFASDRGGRWDLHRLEGDRVVRLTDVATMIRTPAPGPGGSVYAILVHGGRFRLARVPAVELLRLEPVPPLPEGRDAAAWIPPSLDLPPDAPEYEPFEHYGIDAGAIALGTQAVAFGGLAFSDLLRDKITAVQLAVYGELELTDAAVIYLDRSSRLAWLAGAFHTFQPRRDRTFPDKEGSPAFFLEREYGATGGLSYPLNAFERLEVQLVAEAVVRDHYSDPADRPAWRELTGGSEPQLLLQGSYGLDTVRFHPFAGPIAGGSALLLFGGGVLPQRLEGDEGVHGFAEADLQHYLYLGGRTSVLGRAAAGTGFGSRFSKQYYLSSVDNLRGFHWGDERLLGTNYYVANVELSFPLDWLVRLALFEGLRGVVATDFGGVNDEPKELWESRALALVLGLDFLAGPLALRLHFGYPIVIGPVVPADGWVTNLALRLRY